MVTFIHLVITLFNSLRILLVPVSSYSCSLPVLLHWLGDHCLTAKVVFFSILVDLSQVAEDKIALVLQFVCIKQEVSLIFILYSPKME